MREIPFFQVDAFAGRAFEGNPAAVCPLESWLPDAVLQAIAAENNLSETAFFVGRPGEPGVFELRWFTPAAEVDLCGHATLASGFVVMNHFMPQFESVRFHTKSGVLTVTRDRERFVLDFPARPPDVARAPDGLADALGAEPQQVLLSRDVVAVYGRAEDVRRMAPDMARIKALPGVFGVCITAPGTGADEDADFVCRWFGPAVGVPEDPVTGSAYSTLAPYWAERLGRPALHAKQVGPRGGEVWCSVVGDRVRIAGSAVLMIRGNLYL